MKSVTPQQVQEVAKKYFGEENRTVGELQQKNPAGEGGTEQESSAGGPSEARQ